jgi:hypothetical protein
METKFNPCLSLIPYIDYWDEWHKEWYINANSKPPILTPIKGWAIPSGNGGNKNDIWRYFPEPYWGNPNPTELTAVFLNLNPGEGGDCQDLLSLNILNSTLFTTYLSCKYFYDKTVEVLIKNLCYGTTNWFIKKRADWLYQLIFSFKKDYKFDIKNILCADIIPWHTPSASAVSYYINNNHKLIFDHVIDPITLISQCAKFKGLVFAKGAKIKEILDSTLCPKTIYTNGNYSIHIFDYNKAKILVFVGGQGMSLPKLDKEYTSPISHRLMNVIDIINGCLNKKYV